MDLEAPPNSQKTEVSQELVVEILETEDWVKRDKHIYSLLPKIRVQCFLCCSKGMKELSRAVGVSNISNFFLTRFVPDKVNECRYII